jgi:hypothetical protein
VTHFADVLLGLWIAAVTIAAFVVIPALALGRAAGRTRWWPEMLAGAAWSTLAATLLVPLLAESRLLNFTTAVLVPLAWPMALWLYRYRGAPAREFRGLCRRATLRVLTWHASPVRVSVSRRLAASWGIAAAVAPLYWLAARELRFSSPADYDTLAHTRAMLEGGRYIVDPAASLAAIVSRLASVDPMQALRFLRPLTWPGSLVAAALQTPSLNAAYAWTALLAGLLLATVAVTAVHRRDAWHVVAACAVAVFAFGAPGARAGDGGGHVEYDAAARQTLRIAAGASTPNWLVVAPLEQRVELPDPHRFLPLADFVKRFGDRAGERHFRFDAAGHDLFVFVEKVPLRVGPDAALTPVRYAPAAAPYWLPNARARLERRALELCEAYRRSHTGVSIHYDDGNLRIYHIRH